MATNLAKAHRRRLGWTALRPPFMPWQSACPEPHAVPSRACPGQAHRIGEPGDGGGVADGRDGEARVPAFKLTPRRQGPWRASAGEGHDEHHARRPRTLAATTARAGPSACWRQYRRPRPPHERHRRKPQGRRSQGRRAQLGAWAPPRSRDGRAGMVGAPEPQRRDGKARCAPRVPRRCRATAPRSVDSPIAAGRPRMRWGAPWPPRPLLY